MFTGYSRELQRALRLDATACFSVTDQQTADRIAKYMQEDGGAKAVVDACACVGGNTLAFAKCFEQVSTGKAGAGVGGVVSGPQVLVSVGGAAEAAPFGKSETVEPGIRGGGRFRSCAQVLAVELDVGRFAMLAHNCETAWSLKQVPTRCEAIRGDAVAVLPDILAGFRKRKEVCVFVDPPWSYDEGGKIPLAHALAAAVPKKVRAYFKLPVDYCLENTELCFRTSRIQFCKLTRKV